jgi:hypothetical protein
MGVGASKVVNVWELESVAMSPTDSNSGTAGAASTITYVASPGNSHTISGVAWSYGASPTGGNLLIQDGSNTILNLDITAAGPGVIVFPRPKKGTPGANLVITLAGGGGSVQGRVNVLDHWLE